MKSSVALVVVTTDEGEVLRGALESVMRGNAAHPKSVTVVDNASTDGVVEVLAEKWPEMRILRRDTRYGLPENLNHGIKNTTSDYVMLCNSDIVVAPNAIDLLADFLDQHPRAAMVGPKLIGPEGAVRASARRWYTPFVLLCLKGPWRPFTSGLTSVRLSTYEDWDYRSPRSVDWLPCPATLVRRAALEEVGLMDERFRLYFDDVDISLRMHEAGWEVWCLPSAEVVHLEQRASIRPFSKAWRWHLESLLKFVWKHKGLRPSRRTSIQR